jgi:hypothetical protein
MLIRLTSPTTGLTSKEYVSVTERHAYSADALEVLTRGDGSPMGSSDWLRFKARVVHAAPWERRHMPAWTAWLGHWVTQAAGAAAAWDVVDAAYDITFGMMGAGHILVPLM